MATFSINSYTFSFNLPIFIFLFLAAKPISLFAQQALDNNPSFSPHIFLFGDARVEDGGSHVRLTWPHAPSSGLLLLDKPFKFADERNVGRPTSFAAEFSFSLSPGKGDGLAFVIIPNGFQTRFQDQGYFGLFGENRFLGIEFDTKKDDKVGDLNANHVGIDVGSLESVKVSNLSSLNLVLNNGEILKSWVDYDSSSKLLQVRLSKLNDKRPFTPILAYRIDLFEMWGNEDVFVGIISTTNEESSPSSSNVYSWRFRVRDVSSWMHSLPADPRGYVDKDSQEFRAERSNFCALTILAGLIFATGCGALLAFVMLFMWAILVNRHTVFPVECQAGPEDFRYEKVNVIVEKDDQGDKD
ncbi:L-type lectin-domain containing receptor kinase S.4-like [Herrania umbratica]|uniref:L-type lectin-domain containing receptor kinase S.4-like n=1 Tax=Herrania umbratica TaxID=108875 RepID=A0A6J1B7Q3_9ROSI|nr:L-type lectin-domain containing receptor kinase S.4-like [Herrania umbratica]